MRLIEPTAGSVLVLESDLLRLPRSELRKFRRNAQIVLQDLYPALDRRKTVGESIGEPAARVHGVARGHAENEQVAELLRSVGLYLEHGRRLPNEQSAGQRRHLSRFSMPKGGTAGVSLTTAKSNVIVTIRCGANVRSVGRGKGWGASAWRVGMFR